MSPSESPDELLVVAAILGNLEAFEFTRLRSSDGERERVS